jgi:imidazoleglycerol-phosphate dehydratase
MAKKRLAAIERKTNEVEIKGALILDGEGKQDVKTPFDSLNHMLSLFAFHGFFDLSLQAKGDLSHHIVEDIGIALGDAYRKALGDTLSIRRFGFASAPMDEVLVNVSVDISGRPKLVEESVGFSEENLDLKQGDFKNFLESFVNHAKITLHIRLSIPGSPDILKVPDSHHYFEALFKALAIALDKASQIDSRRKGIPSTKGIIDL